LAAPELARRYPLVFSSGARTQSAFRSQHHNIPSLVSKQPQPLGHLYRRDADARGIGNGDRVPLPTAADRAREHDRQHPERATLVLAAAGAELVLGPEHSVTRALARASETMDKADLWRARAALKRLRREVREQIAAAVEN
jgi:hypothetical protein